MKCCAIGFILFLFIHLQIILFLSLRLGPYRNLPGWALTLLCELEVELADFQAMTAWCQADCGVLVACSVAVNSVFYLKCCDFTKPIRFGNSWFSSITPPRNTHTHTHARTHAHTHTRTHTHTYTHTHITNTHTYIYISMFTYYWDGGGGGGGGSVIKWRKRRKGLTPS